MTEHFDDEWRGFERGDWSRNIDVRDFIQRNYEPYRGDASFLEGPTENTKKLMEEVSALQAEEAARGGVLDADTAVPSSILSHPAGYIDEKREIVVGLQTDKPLKRAMHPKGGVRTAKKALEEYGFKMDPATEEIFTKFRKTHNDAVFDAYTPEMKRARHAHILTGLPDSYGRGRIVGDYRRVALYGVDALIEEKKNDLEKISGEMTEEKIRLREEVAEQIKALGELEELARLYKRDVSRPASNALEAVQALYFGYLAAVKDQNGAAMSLGRDTGFLDIYIERDMREGTLTESEAQEIIDQFVIKLRLVKFMRTREYNELFSGDPTWVTETIGGMGEDGRTLVTKTGFRMLHTLETLGTAPEPNLTVLWSEDLPEGFKTYCASLSERTSAIQYENDELLRAALGDDCCIACCVSGMREGRDMQFFGARANIAKCVLYAINGGRDEIERDCDGNPLQVSPPMDPIEGDGKLDFDEVMEKLDAVFEWLAGLYVDTLNIIHKMHDTYSYEALEMALHDTNVRRFFATGIAGLSCAADSLSAIKYADVYPIRDDKGVAVDFETVGEYPRYGNDDNRADEIAVWLVTTFMKKIRKHPTYRRSIPTTSVLTITSNVVYGKHTGSTPDGRKRGEPLAPGANPMHGRDVCGAAASLLSVSKIPYEHARDGISYTFSLAPNALGKDAGNFVRERTLSSLLDGYFSSGGYHLNVNVLDKAMLRDAQSHPERYPNLTIRVSGYAVNFHKLTREQQDEVIERTVHERM